MSDHCSTSHERAGADPHSAHDHRTRSECRAAFYHASFEHPVVLCCKRSRIVRRAREPVIDEQYSVADEDLVTDLHTSANERMALDLAPRSDHGIALDLHERPDSRLVADPAAVEVRECEDDDVLAEVNVLDESIRRSVYGFTGQFAPGGL